MRILMSTIFALGLVLAGPAGSSAGGGNFIDWGRTWYLPGQEVAGTIEVYAEDLESVERHAPYFAYLVPRGDGWFEAPRLPDEARIVGWVEPVRLIQLPDGTWTRGTRTRFTAPSEPGEYEVAICNRPCTRRLGDVDTTILPVFASAVEAELRPQLERARWKLESLRDRLARAQGAIEVGERRAASTEGSLRRQVDALAERAATLRRRLTEAQKRSTWLWPAGAGLFIVGAAIGWMIPRTARPRAAGAPLGPSAIEMLALMEEPEELELSRRP